MITLIGTPAVVVDSEVSPEEYSYLLATESPVLFTFQKVDANVVGVTEATSPYADMIEIEHDAGEIVEAGTKVYVFDSLYGEMIEYTAAGGDDGYIYINDEYEARFASDWLYIIVPDNTPNAYIEVRLKVNDVYLDNTIRYTYNTKGVAVCDISRFLQAEISIDKVGTYSNVNDAETNQSGKFELEYRERYDGDSSTWVEEGSEWYYVYAVRSKEQGSNLWEFWDIIGQENLFNQFAYPVWWIGSPFDIQFWWNPKYAALELTRNNYDASGSLLSTQTETLDDDGLGYLNSIRIDEDLIEATCDYITLEFAEP